MPALPDQRATSRMSCKTDSGSGSGRSWRTARRPRKKAIRAEEESVSDESVIGGLSAEAQVQPSSFSKIYVIRRSSCDSRARRIDFTCHAASCLTETGLRSEPVGAVLGPLTGRQNAASASAADPDSSGLPNTAAVARVPLTRALHDLGRGAEVDLAFFSMPNRIIQATRANVLARLGVAMRHPKSARGLRASRTARMKVGSTCSLTCSKPASPVAMRARPRPCTRDCFLDRLHGANLVSIGRLLGEATSCWAASTRSPSKWRRCVRSAGSRTSRYSQAM